MKLQYVFLLVLVGLLLFGCAQGKTGTDGSPSAAPPSSGQVGAITESDLPAVDDPEFGDDLEGSDLSVE